MDEPLGRTDFDTPTWRRIVAHLEHRRAEQIAKLIRPQSEETVTHTLRGTIRVIDELLALPTAAPAQRPAPAMRPTLTDE